MLRKFAEDNNIDLGGATRRQDIVNIIQTATATQGTPTGNEEANTPPDVGNATEGAESTKEGEAKTGDGDEVEQDTAETPEDTPADGETKTDEVDGTVQVGGEVGASVIETPENVIDQLQNDPDDGEIVIEPLFDRVLKGLRLPMRGDDVTALHARLEKKGLSVGTDRANGIYGGRTAYAVRVFQARNRLIVDGRVGKYTAAALGFTWQG